MATLHADSEHAQNAAALPAREVVQLVQGSTFMSVFAAPLKSMVSDSAYCFTDHRDPDAIFDIICCPEEVDHQNLEVFCELRLRVRQVDELLNQQEQIKRRNKAQPSTSALHLTEGRPPARRHIWLQTSGLLQVHSNISAHEYMSDVQPGPPFHKL
jgi:hypothetical protein